MSGIKKDKIKDRMIKTAARIWGVQDQEVESNFDPLVELLIEACSSELEKINHEISLTHTRLLGRLIDLILPETIFGPVPASCVMQVTPGELKTAINPLHQFHTGQINALPGQEQENMDFYFSPIGKFTLHQAQLSYIFAGSSLFRHKQGGLKELIHSKDQAKDTNDISNEFWLAISVPGEQPSLNGLQLFFSLGSHSESLSFYNSLGRSAATLNDHEIALKKGYSEPDQFELSSPEEILVSGNNMSAKLCRQVAYIYSHRFFHIITGETVQEVTLPEHWKQVLPGKIASEIANEKLVYIKITLDNYFPQTVFDTLNCAINAFPALNRRLNSITYRTDEWLNVIPLPIEDHFFYLQAIMTASGGEYRFRTSAHANELQEGEAILKINGVGKITSREVRDLTGVLVEAIRDQSAYFGEVGNEYILSRLREINQILSGLEEQISIAKDNHATHYYLLLRPRQGGETIHIDYWMSNGSRAHYLRPGVKLNPVGNNQLNIKYGMLLTAPAGAKDSFSENDKKNILRHQLGANEKIISASDVKLLCYRLFGNRLQKVEVNKGVHVSPEKQKGFFRSIDITITYAGNITNINQPELQNLVREFEYQLQNHASPVYPFHVIQKTVHDQ
jgi:hypothetical protein